MEREGSELRCELTRYGFKVGDVVYDRWLRVSMFLLREWQICQVCAANLKIRIDEFLIDDEMSRNFFLKNLVPGYCFVFY